MMSARKATVRGGRIVLDEPTNLPDGAEVEIAIYDDGLDAREREALHASLERAEADAEAGRSEDAWVFLSRYRALRANRPA